MDSAEIRFSDITEGLESNFYFPDLWKFYCFDWMLCMVSYGFCRNWIFRYHSLSPPYYLEYQPTSIGSPDSVISSFILCYNVVSSNAK